MTSNLLRDAATRESPTAGAWERYSRYWIWVAISLGLVLRAAQYVTNRSLWLDEAYLALNVLHRPVTGLFKPLEYHQGAPFGFLLLEKLATKLAGNSELALRAVPLALGVLGLLFFARLAKLYVSPCAVPAAVSLFAFCGPLIYYSSEAKQYSSDVAFTLLLLWLLSRLADAPLTTGELVRAALLGAFSVWFSHPAAFVLSGGGLALLSFALIHHERRRVVRLSCICGIWALSFLGYYMISLHRLSEDGELLNFWRNYFPPQPFWWRQAFSFLIERFFGIFDDPVRVFLSSARFASFWDAAEWPAKEAFISGCWQVLCW